MRRRPSHRLLRLAAFAACVPLLAVPGAVAGATGSRLAPSERVERAPKPFFEARLARPERPATAAQQALASELGLQGVVDVDPSTGTPRVVARLDGFLTGPSTRDAREIALDYVRAHPGVFRLDEDDLAMLRVSRDYVDVRGTRHIVWAQTWRGIPAFDNDLRANVAADGRLINVMGSPQPDLRSRVSRPLVDAVGALRGALLDVGRRGLNPRILTRSAGATRTTRFAGGHRAGLVLYNDGRRMRLAWHVTARADSDELYNSIVDAETGAVLRRANKVADVSALAWDFHPTSAANGGASTRTFDGWLTPGASTLTGPNAHVFADVDGDDDPDLSGEEIGSSGGNWNFALDPSTHTHAAGNCAPNGAWTSVCTWKSTTNASWEPQRKQNGTQVFYFVNTFHDYLKNDPGIGFNAASGAFEGGDKLVAHSDDGARTDGLLPDEGHLNNANMATPPNGQSPTMQMYLFKSTGPSDPTPDANGGDDASVVYHEYAHGLSNRLITYSDGWGALDAFQAGAMGEGWSDWYAMDYLVAQGFAPDTAADGEVVLGAYLGNGASLFRTEGLDCPVGSGDASCPGGSATGAGGYTFGDLGSICSCGPEEHADGEIWAQTLWDLRGAVGSSTARLLVTDGMRLSPDNPSFLDMRNAILQADVDAFGGANGAAIWNVFAARGMGYFASSDDSDDVAPIESFALPPDPALGTGGLAGKVTDGDTGAPVAGVRVAFGGHDSGLPGALADTTDSRGRYLIAGVPVGTYPRVVAAKVAHRGDSADAVSIAAATTSSLNFEVRRNWSSYWGGGRVTDLTGPDLSSVGCGPAHALDGSLQSGWASELPAPRMTLRLPRYVDVSGFGVDPGATCGDPEDAATASYRVEVSKSGAAGSWVVAKSGTFGAPHVHRVNTLSTATRPAVRFVRIILLSSQGHPQFVDLSELEVYGRPTPLCLGQPATKVGTDGANRINGTSRADVIVGNGGGDKIDGRGGNDLICGGAGNDTLTGGDGVDKFDGGAGNDTIFSRDGLRERTVKGGSGKDRARRDASDRLRSVERVF